MLDFSSLTLRVQCPDSRSSLLLSSLSTHLYSPHVGPVASQAWGQASAQARGLQKAILKPSVKSLLLMMDSFFYIPVLSTDNSLLACLLPFLSAMWASLQDEQSNSHPMVWHAASSQTAWNSSLSQRNCMAGEQPRPMLTAEKEGPYTLLSGWLCCSPAERRGPHPGPDSTGLPFLCSSACWITPLSGPIPLCVDTASAPASQWQDSGFCPYHLYCPNAVIKSHLTDSGSLRKKSSLFAHKLCGPK